jgi:opacity protein-like surface antigen
MRMKRIYLVMMVVLFSVAAYGQTAVGVKGGLNFSNIKHGEDLDERFDNLDNPFQIGFNFGLAADIYVGEMFSLYTELMYTQKGESYEGTGTANDPVVGQIDVMEETEVTLNYLELPVLARFKFGDMSKFYLNIGPTVGYWLGGNVEFESERGDDTESIDSEIDFKDRDEINQNGSQGGFVLANEDVNRFEVGGAIGTGVFINNKFNIDLRYTMGFTSIHENAGEDQDDTWKNNVLSFSIGYFFRGADPRDLNRDRTGY